MTDHLTMTDDTPFRPAEPHVAPSRRIRPSLVWGIPLIAALIGLALVVQTLSKRGPTITVSFASAEGIEPGKTKVKFKNVDIGDVKTVTLTPDRTRVTATIDLVKEAETFAVEGSRFWVVRPRFAGSGISGLGTLLSGAYIAVDVGRSDRKVTDFTGVDEPPVVASDVPGRRFQLHAADLGSLDVGSPVFFRRIEAGHVEWFSLNPDGNGLTLGVFIKAPYDRFVTPDSRFWHASGVDLRLDAGGVRVQTQSLATILLGGVAFETLPGGDPAAHVAEGTQFWLAADRTEALKAPDGTPQTLVLRFRQSIRGLSVGAPVDFRGIEIGQVRSIDVTYDRSTGDFFSPVVVDIYPQRLGSASATFRADSTPEQQLQLLGNLVRHGLRAQLRSGNLLTGQLYVALDFFPKADPVRFDARLDPPELPTLPSDLQELQAQVQGILRKVEALPLETLGQDAHRVMTALEGTLKRLDTLAARADRETLPEVVLAVRDLRQTLKVLEGNMAGDAPLPQETRQALKGLSDAARSIKVLTDTLERNPEALLQGKKESSR